MSVPFFILALSLASTAVRTGPSPTPTATIPIRLPSGKAWQAEIMRTFEERQRGLMFRPSLAEDRVLLFVNAEPDFQAIWMKNCRFPIDVIWLDDDRRVVHVAAHVPPCRQDPCPSYAPMRKALYFIETNAGVARREKLTIGTKLEFTLGSPVH